MIFRVFVLIVLGACGTFTNVLAANPDEMGEYMEGDIVSIAPSLLTAKTRAGMNEAKYRWPNATIPYEFSSSYQDQQLRSMFDSAINHISSRTCIKFVPRTNQKDYINLISGSGCYSHVGRIGGKQDVSLPSNCLRLGIFVHELVHAIGFQHEQSRSDRDDYVTVNYSNVKPGMAVNFEKYSSKLISNFGVGYDYGSVMHYSKNAFSKDGRSDTLIPKQGRNIVIGQRTGMSKSDVTKVNNMYSCKDGRSNSGEASDFERLALRLFRRK